jgi:hypothetical protein
MGIIIEDSKATFDGNWLHIHFRPAVDFELRISSWDCGLEVQPWYGQEENYEYESFDPNLDIFNQSCYTKNSQINKWLQTIPQDLTNLVQDLEINQLTILRLIKSNPYCEELMRNSPTLLLLFSHYLLVQELTISEGAQFLNNSKIIILESITGRTCTKADIKFINKFSSNSFGIEEIEVLYRAVQNQQIVSRFFHIPTTNKAALMVALEQPVFLGSKLFNKLTENPEQVFTVARLWSDTQRMGRQLGLPDYQNVLRLCKTVEHLQRLHDRWSQRLHLPENLNPILRAVMAYGTQDFPTPPFQGNKNILPIKNVMGLFEEGQEMHHCIGSYAEKVFEGESYVYKVVEPERATLEIICRNKKWTIRGFKLAHNQRPSDDSRKYIQEWFENNIQNAGELE